MIKNIKYILQYKSKSDKTNWWKIANHSSNDWSVCDPARIESARIALKEIKQLIESIESFNEYD